MKKNLFSLAVSALFLSACTQAAVTGGQAVYDREGAGVTAGNQLLNLQLLHLFHQHSNAFQNARVVATAYDQLVLLTGQVNNENQRREAEALVRQIPVVVKIANELTIAPHASKKQIARDAWITTKLKSKLLTQIGVDPSKIKVVTENNVVYLLGNVSKEQADIAVQLARELDGVQKVVNVFHTYQYLN